METILKIATGALGLIVPCLFVLIIKKGIKNSPFEEAKRTKYRRILIIAIGIWTALIWVLSLIGVISYHEGDSLPRFVIALMIPVLIGFFLLIRNKVFHLIITSAPLSALVGAQIFRFAGSSFLILANMEILPHVFVTAGYGDILTGAFALIACLALINKAGKARLSFWLFNIIGLMDLLNVAFLLVAYYPIFSNAKISSAAAGDFPLVLIPALVAPIALLLHIYSIRSFLVKEKQSANNTNSKNN
jgi:hypothetical protein